MGYSPNRSHPLDVQIRAALEALLGLQTAYGQISLTDTPTEGDYLTLDDGVNDPITYEFVAAAGNSVIGGAVEVLIGDEAFSAATNLVAAINANTPGDANTRDRQPGIVAALTSTDTYDESSSSGTNEATISVENTMVGSAGNVDIVVSGSAISTVGMLGGSDGECARNDARPLQELGSEKLTLSAADDATIPAGTSLVRMCSSSGDITWSLGGTADADSAPLAEGAVEYLEVDATSALSVYSSSATVHLSYFSRR